MAGSLKLTREQLSIITGGDPRAIKAFEDFFTALNALGTHAATHQPGGADPLAVDAAPAVGSLRTLGIGAQKAAAGIHAGTHVTGGGDTVADAVSGGASGLMSGADKAKLDGLGGSLPAGTIIMHGADSETPPTGYLYCNGASVLRADYPDLYTAIGNAWGTADGTHFNLPDFRGKFPRGKANGSANDPDRAARAAQAAGGNTGDKVGSVQAGAYASHSHHVATVNGSGLGSVMTRPFRISVPTQNPTSDSWDTDTNGGNETRPINAYVNFFIKT